MTTFPKAPAALLFAAAALIGSSAQAQPAVEGRAALVQKLADCRKLTEDAARLACYDATAAALEQAEAKGDIVVVDREQARKVRRQAFGFSLPSLAMFERGETKDEIESIESRIASARQDAAGKWIIKLEDGGTWMQIDTVEVSRTPRAGMAARIRKATLGSFMLSIEGGRAFRARRVE